MCVISIYLKSNYLLVSKLVNDTATNNKIAQNHFKKILVGVDGSEKSFQAVEYAINFAKKCESELLLIVNILPIEPWYHGEYPYEWGKPEILEEVYEKGT